MWRGCVLRVEEIATHFSPETAPRTSPLNRWHSLLCAAAHSCDSIGLALTGPQSHLCCGLCERHCSTTYLGTLSPTVRWV